MAPNRSQVARRRASVADLALRTGDQAVRRIAVWIAPDREVAGVAAVNGHEDGVLKSELLDVLVHQSEKDVHSLLRLGDALRRLLGSKHHCAAHVLGHRVGRLAGRAHKDRVDQVSKRETLADLDIRDAIIVRVAQARARLHLSPLADRDLVVQRHVPLVDRPQGDMRRHDLRHAALERFRICLLLVHGRTVGGIEYDRPLGGDVGCGDRRLRRHGDGHRRGDYLECHQCSHHAPQRPVRKRDCVPPTVGVQEASSDQNVAVLHDHAPLDRNCRG